MESDNTFDITWREINRLILICVIPMVNCGNTYFETKRKFMKFDCSEFIYIITT